MYTAIYITFKSHTFAHFQGEELGPLEQEVNALQKSIDTRTQEIADQQQFWLRQQSELVKMTKDKDGQHKEVDTMKKALTILHQKKLRIESKWWLFH